MEKKTYLMLLLAPSFMGRDGKAMPNTGGWQDRHMRALRSPNMWESAVGGMIQSWAKYADIHQATYGTGIGTDGVLGDSWRDAGLALRGMLNGETGRFDCGTLDAFLCDTLEAEGFKLD